MWHFADKCHDAVEELLKFRSSFQPKDERATLIFLLFSLSLEFRTLQKETLIINLRPGYICIAIEPTQTGLLRFSEQGAKSKFSNFFYRNRAEQIADSFSFENYLHFFSRTIGQFSVTERQHPGEGNPAKNHYKKQIKTRFTRYERK